jgi:pyroglutamyl-peptidase
VRVLLTAFEPFDGGVVNSSLEACRQVLAGLDSRGLPGVREVRLAVLPVEYGHDSEAMEVALAGFTPDLLLHTGQSSGAAELRLERLAVNVRYREHGIGRKRHEQQPIVADGPAALACPLTVSNHAGIYLCNHVLYCSLLRFQQLATAPAAFLHLPLLPEQAGEGQPALPLETLARGVELTMQLLAHALQGAETGWCGGPANGWRWKRWPETETAARGCGRGAGPGARGAAGGAENARGAHQASSGPGCPR